MKRFIFIFLALFSVHSFANQLSSKPKESSIDIQKVFTASPLIYTTLSLLSLGSMVIWLYSLATFRSKDILPQHISNQLQTLLKNGQIEEAKQLCVKDGKMLGTILLAGLSTRNLGTTVMMDSMKSIGKKATTPFWQRLSLLNDVVIIAPMFGLLGTVVGMFYAFYDMNRSVESINALYDGIGISVGTTVAGLLVAILSMIFYTSLKYRMVKLFSKVENEAIALSTLIGRGE